MNFSNISSRFMTFGRLLKKQPIVKSPLVCPKIVFCSTVQSATIESSFQNKNTFQKLLQYRNRLRSPLVHTLLLQIKQGQTRLEFNPPRPHLRWTFPHTHQLGSLRHQNPLKRAFLVLNVDWYTQNAKLQMICYKFMISSVINGAQFGCKMVT